MFSDREQAGTLLAIRVKERINELPPVPDGANLVIALPRGGVPVAREVALALGCPLTILVSKKIGAPSQPECAAGAVSSTGVVVLNPTVMPYLRNFKSYLQQEAKRLTQTTRAIEEKWLQQAGLRQASFAGKRCILVDDGIATGMTIWAAIETMKRAGARSVIVAAPVMPPSTKRELEKSCDAVVAVITPPDLVAVGCHYFDFHQVEDDEMIESLRSVEEQLPQVKRQAS